MKLVNDSLNLFQPPTLTGRYVVSGLVAKLATRLALIERQSFFQFYSVLRNRRVNVRGVSTNNYCAFNI